MAESLARDGSGPLRAPGRLIDLSEVDRASRKVMWEGAASSAFPGLSVKLPARMPRHGSINRFKIGAGELFAIDSAPAEVAYRPPRAGGLSLHMSLMMQSRGSTRISQAGRRCDLAQGDICLIDESNAFRLVGEESSGILFLRLPRAAVLSRHPQLGQLCARALPGGDTGTRLLADTLTRLLNDVGGLDELQLAAMMDAVVEMIGVAEPLCARAETGRWRVSRALEFIELNLAIAGLSAESVAHAQHISRRQLDYLMRETLGRSIAGQIWTRRLERAAADLRDPRRAGMTIAQIAFSNGFEDAAHFTRAFKRRFAATPRQSRAA